jgi:hypothetical protein
MMICNSKKNDMRQKKIIKDINDPITKQTFFKLNFLSLSIISRSKDNKSTSDTNQPQKGTAKVINISTKITACMLIAAFISCTKLVEVDPPVTNVNADNVYTNDITATAVLTGLYTRLAQGVGGFTGIDGISVRAGLSADEFAILGNVTASKILAYYRNNLSVSTGLGSELWAGWYQSIYYCNAAVEGIATSKAISEGAKEQLMGEAKFLRAFLHFYLLNTFGDIPIVLTTDYKVNSFLGKTLKDKVYLQIISDLKEAEELLSENFLNGSLQPYVGEVERVRPSKWAAKAMLARVYLYTKNYVNAEQKASEVIDAPLFAMANTGNTFLRAGLGNKEAIWQLQPVISGWNTEDARVLLLNGAIGNNRPVQLSKSLLTVFEPGDKRRIDWVRDTVIAGNPVKYVFKYKSAKLNNSVTEYLMVLRLAEQYLIRAEARAAQDNLQGAVNDLNILRNRARAMPTVDVPNPLPDWDAGVLSKVQVLDKVMGERRIELFSEWGHRWYDLKRTNTIDVVMTTAAIAKGGIWDSYKQLYPIPTSEIERNYNMVQNSGY